MSYDLVSLKFLSCFKTFLVHVHISPLSNPDNVVAPTELQPDIATRLTPVQKLVEKKQWKGIKSYVKRHLSVIL